MKNNNIIGFYLYRIHTNEFAIIEEAYRKKGEIKYNITTSFATQKNDQIINCIISFKFLRKDTPFLKINLECHYKLKEESWNELLNKEKNEIILPKNFADHLAALTLGTLRGALHAKTEGLEFNKYFVPTMNIQEMSKDIELFNLSLD